MSDEPHYLDHMVSFNKTLPRKSEAIVMFIHDDEVFDDGHIPGAFITRTSRGSVVLELEDGSELTVKDDGNIFGWIPQASEPGLEWARERQKLEQQAILDRQLGAAFRRSMEYSISIILRGGEKAVQRVLGRNPDAA